MGRMTTATHLCPRTFTRVTPAQCHECYVEGNTIARDEHPGRGCRRGTRNRVESTGAGRAPDAVVEAAHRYYLGHGGERDYPAVMRWVCGCEVERA